MSTSDTPNIPETTTAHPRYDAYKDSGVEWLGEIPEHWETVALKYVTRFNNGASFSSSDWQSEGIPIIRISNLNGDTNFNCVSVEEDVDLSHHVRQGDLLFAWSGNRGTSFGPHIWDKKGLHYLNQHIYKLTDYDLDARYFYWALKGVTHYVEEQAHGIIGMVHITQAKLGATKIPAISLPEQRAIAAYLDRETERIDTLVAKKERLIELLEEKRTALISHAVTKGLDDDAEMKDSGVEWLGKIPTGWQKRKVKYAASIQRGVFSHRPRNDPRLYEGDHPFIQTGDIAGAGKFVDSYEQTLNDAGLSVSRKFPPGTLVMTIAANIGDLAITKFAACFPDSIVSMTPKSGLDQEYLYYVLTAMRNSLRKASVANTQLNLNVERIGNLYMTVPPWNEQRQIVARLNDEAAMLERLAARVRDGIDRLKEYRTALISAAVTGQIDVQEAV